MISVLILNYIFALITDDVKTEVTVAEEVDIAEEVIEVKDEDKDVTSDFSDVEEKGKFVIRH